MKKQILVRKKKFTVVEILAVVLIISMLAVFVIPRAFKGMSKAKGDIARSKMAIIEGALGKFYLDCQRFPDESEGLNALITMPADMENQWTGPYLKKSDLLDPWKNNYVYQAEGAVNIGSYDLKSYGADGSEGGEGENSDIINE
ncbi:MAG: type II secretion system major pseudopilin GspG [Planctomycetes bacterium]|nr:type II secretion system major pseudopilin GspG [Planctomycetota bacterium]